MASNRSKGKNRVKPRKNHIRTPLPMPSDTVNLAYMTQAVPDFLKPEIITVHSDTIACDGGGGPIGHPRVYISLLRNGQADCPYCDRQYVLAANATAQNH